MAVWSPTVENFGPFIHEQELFSPFIYIKWSKQNSHPISFKLRRYFNQYQFIFLSANITTQAPTTWSPSYEKIQELVKTGLFSSNLKASLNHSFSPYVQEHMILPCRYLHYCLKYNRTNYHNYKTSWGHSCRIKRAVFLCDFIHPFAIKPLILSKICQIPSSQTGALARGSLSNSLSEYEQCQANPLRVFARLVSR